MHQMAKDTHITLGSIKCIP